MLSTAQRLSLRSCTRSKVAALRSHLSSTSTDVASNDGVPLDIPEPSGKWPIVGHLPRLVQTDQGNSVKNWKAMHEECGDIYRVSLPGNKNIVVTCNPSHVREILSQQGKDVYRAPQNSWKPVFEDNQWPTAIPVATGDDWIRKRKVLSENLLNLKTAKTYVPLVLPAANNLVDCLTGHLNQEGRIVETTSLRELAAMFALEAVMKVVVGVDFPSCTVPINEKAAGFAKAVETQFRQTKVCEDMPWHVTFKTKAYRDLEKAWQEMHRYPSETLQPILEYYEKNGELPEEVHGTVFYKLMQAYEAGDLSLKEVLGIGVQAISAATDTTGQTTEYLFYNLAHNPDVQERLVQEIQDTIGPNEGPLDMTIPQYEQQKYLFATLKESMRYTPTVGAHARTMTKDFNVGGYHLPQGQLVLLNFLAMTNNPELYPEPDLFLPERFLRGNNENNNPPNHPATSSTNSSCPFAAANKAEAIEKGHAVCKDPFAAIPFGHGGRKCPGAGFAQMDIHLLTLAILRKYKVTYDGPPLEQTEKQLLRSKQDLSPHFQFEPRL